MLLPSRQNPLRGALVAQLLVSAIILLGYVLYGQFTSEAAMDAMTITSPEFKHNAVIPSKFTCDGSDINPRLMISNVPAGAKSLALIVDDPDAPRGTWVHWVVWNIDPATKEIPENSVPPKASQGLNDFRKQAYGGPCPPPGTHRYFFKLYALDTTPALSANANKATLEAAMKGHILAQCELVGRYSRK